MSVVSLFTPTGMTGDTTPSPFIVTYTASYFPGYYAFNTSAALYWIGNGTGPWLQIYTGVRYRLMYYSLKMNTIPEPTRAPKDWIMYGSLDGSNFVALDTVTDEVSWGNGESRVFYCDPTAKTYNYFRLDISANNGDGSYTQVALMSLYGYPLQEKLTYIKDRFRSRLNLNPIST